MPVIWGLDLREMQWGKFKSSYMFNKDYHLRCTKMIFVFQPQASIFYSRSAKTILLLAKFRLLFAIDYVDQQKKIEKLLPGATVYNDDFIGVASYNIFVGIYVATIFGAGFFFDLFWPERHESKSVRLAWKICAVLACVFGLADAIAFTVIVALHMGYIHAHGADLDRISQLEFHPPLVYRHNGRGIASIVLLWLGWVATCASAAILIKSHLHDDLYGPKSKTLRGKEIRAEREKKAAEESASTTPAPTDASIV